MISYLDKNNKEIIYHNSFFNNPGLVDYVLFFKSSANKKVKTKLSKYHCKLFESMICNYGYKIFYIYNDKINTYFFYENLQSQNINLNNSFRQIFDRC